MVYPLSSPRENPNSEREIPLIDPIGKGQQLSIIENRSSKLMISIRKESPNPQVYIYIYITFFIVPVINEYMIMNTLLFIKLG